MKLSIVIPVYNEQSHLLDVFKYISAVQFPCPVEYVLIDDASKDDSWKVMESIRDSYPNVVIAKQPHNMGKGAALHRGFDLAVGDIIAVQDADFEYDPTDLPRLVQPILDDRADVVYGSRFHKEKRQVFRTFHYLVNRLLTIVSNLCTGIYLSDMETCYKVFRSDILKSFNLESQRFGFEPEITAKIAKLKLRMEEHPISYYPRSYDEGKKIGWRDGIAALWFIWKFSRMPIDRQIKRSMPSKYFPKGRLWL